MFTEVTWVLQINFNYNLFEVKITSCANENAINSSFLIIFVARQLKRYFIYRKQYIKCLQRGSELRYTIQGIFTSLR